MIKWEKDDVRGKQMQVLTGRPRALLRGVDQLADAVRVTLGPRGRNVMLEKSWGSPTVTKDGVTVAKEIELEDHFEKLGAKMVREVASKTSDVAGDGTTTATVLAQAIFSEGTKMVAAGMNPMDLKRGIDKAVAVLVEDLGKQSRKTRTSEEIAQVGTISANGDEAVGAILAEAMEKVGKEGVITVEEAKGMETTLEVVEGMQFDRGYLSPYFVTKPRAWRWSSRIPHAASREEDQRMKDLLPVLEKVSQQGKPLLIVAEDVEGEALATLVVNKIRGTLKVRSGEGTGLRGSSQGDARGHGDRDRRGGDRRGARAEARERDAQGPRRGRGRDQQGPHDVHRGRGLEEGDRGPLQPDPRADRRDHQGLRSREARGAAREVHRRRGSPTGRRGTETEMKERKDRLEDALHATRAATEEGMVPGGGVALLRAQRALDGLEESLSEGRSSEAGVKIIRRAIEEPLRWIAGR